MMVENGIVFVIDFKTGFESKVKCSLWGSSCSACDTNKIDHGENQEVKEIMDLLEQEKKNG
jgi:positive regulator of sigma E activity